MSSALSGYGTLLKRGDGGAPEVFTTVAEVRSMTGPSMEVGETEVTTHSSAAAGSFREYIATLIDAGQIEFEINYVPSFPQHSGIRNDLLARTLRNWKIVLPGNIETVSFTAFVKAAPYEFPTDDAIKQKITLRITGAPVWS
jgi:predicted secreted protein